MDYKTYLQNRLDQGVSLSIGKAIGDGFSYFGKKPGPFILYLLVFFGISMVASVLGMVPYVGSLIVSVLVTPPLVMGFATYNHKAQTGDYPVFENFFDAFKINYLNLALVNLIIQGIGWAITALLLTPYLGDFSALMASAGSDPDAIVDIMQEIAAGMLDNIWIIVGAAIAYIVLMVFYSFANYFVIFYGFSFWEAMESSRILVGKVFFSLIGLFFVTGVLLLVGTVVTLFIGLLVFIPVLYLISYSAFEQVAGLPTDEKQIEDDLII